MGCLHSGKIANNLPVDRDQEGNLRRTDESRLVRIGVQKEANRQSHIAWDCKASVFSPSALPGWHVFCHSAYRVSHPLDID